MKKSLYLFVVMLVLTAGIWLFADIQSTEAYYLAHHEDIGEDSETVTLEIRCDSVLAHYDELPEQLKNEKYIPGDGIILKETKVVLRPGDSAFDILSRSCRYYNIPYEYQGTGKSAYIQGIHYLYEFSCGRLSGWMYQVNEEWPGVGCGSYALKDGDRILFAYTCDLGKDIGNEYGAKEEKP